MTDFADRYIAACKRAATAQGLDPLTAEVNPRRAELHSAGVSYGVEQTGGFTMVACFYIGANVVTVTNEGDWIVCAQSVEEWQEYTGDTVEDLSSPALSTPAAIVDAVLARAQQ